LCMLIDGIVKRYPTAMVELDTPYFSGRTKVLCMDNPVQDIIIGNIPGASGVHPNLVNTKATVNPDKVDKPTKDGKPQFFEKKGILYRRYFGR